MVNAILMEGPGSEKLDPSRWRLIQDIFDKARRLSPEGRASWLAEACSGDTMLRGEIESLLEAAEGDFRGSVPLFDESASKFRLAGDQHGEGDALNSEGGAMANVGEPLKALQLYRQSRSLFAAAGDRRLEAILLNNIATTEGVLARFQAALDHYRQALPLFQELGDRRQEANLLKNMGLIYSRMGELDQAQSLFDRALPMLRLTGDRRLEADTLGALGNLYIARTQPAKALEYLAQAETLWNTLVNRQGQAGTLMAQGLAHAQLLQMPEAERALLMRALELARNVHDRYTVGRSLVYLAGTALRRGDAVKSSEWGEEAVAELHSIGVARWKPVRWKPLPAAKTRGTGFLRRCAAWKNRCV